MLNAKITVDWLREYLLRKF